MHSAMIILGAVMLGSATSRHFVHARKIGPGEPRPVHPIKFLIGAALIIAGIGLGFASSDYED